MIIFYYLISVSGIMVSLLISNTLNNFHKILKRKYPNSKIVEYLKFKSSKYPVTENNLVIMWMYPVVEIVNFIVESYLEGVPYAARLTKENFIDIISIVKEYKSWLFKQ